MKTRNSTKSKLLSSVIALVLCVSMLIGATFAWFTDTASTGVNKIQAGNLDVKVEYSKDRSTWTDIQDATSLFSNNLWEPGHTEYVYLRVKNAGTLGLKYKVMVTPVSENGGINVNNANFKLSDYLVFGTTDPAAACPSYTRDTARAAVGTTKGLNQANLTKENSILANGADQYLSLVVYMPESVGNEANAKPGTVAPSINLGITVVATQLKAENDSFNNTYDQGAVNDSKYVAGAYYDYFEAVNVTATAENGAFTVEKTDSNAGVIASASGVAATGTKVSMVITKTSTPTGNFDITVEEGHELNCYDIKVTGQTENSLVQGKLYVGTGLENFVFYHDGSAMTLGTKGSLTDGQYVYDGNDGYVYFATKTFSPFQATYKAPVAAIGTAVYGTVADAFAAVKSGETITLLKDSAGNGIVVPSDSRFTVDFNSFTYDVNGALVGSSGTETNSFQLLKDSTITFKNGALTSAKAKILIQNYSNLTLENMSLTAGSQCGYVLSNNNGHVVIKDTTINAAKGKVAFDVCRYASYVGPEVTVEGNSVINGNVEISSSGAKEGATHKLNVTGGTFNGKFVKRNSPNFVGNITGGTFKTNPAEFVDQTKYGIVSNSTSFKVTEKWATVGDTSWYKGSSANEYTISTAEQLAGFANLVSNGTNFAGKTVKLGNNINLDGKLWVPIGMKVTEVGSSQPTATSKRFTGIFDGKNHTISNMRIDQWYATNGKGSTMYGLGLFHDMSGTLKNLTIENAVVKASDGSPMKGNIFGIVAGYSYGNVTYENVHVINSNLATGDVCAFGKVGGILGMAADRSGTTRFINCSVKNTTIAGVYNCAGFAGLVQNAVVMTGCVSENVVWKAGLSESEYIAINDLADDNTSMVSGTYWNYDGYYIYTGWSEYYNDYANCVSGGRNQNVTHDGESYYYDGYCHNTLPTAETSTPEAE